MVVWLSTPAMEAAFEDGVIRREHWRSVHRLDDAVKAVRARRDAIFEAATRQACARVDQVEQEVAAIRAEALADADRLRAEAHAQGLAQGLEEWHARLQQGARAQSDQLLARRRRLAELVVNLVERIVTAQGSQALFERAMAEVAKGIETLRHATLQVASCDGEAARSALREARARCEGLRILEIVEMAELAPGSCRLLTDEGTVDTSLSVQLQALRRLVERDSPETPA